jgi:hypothetical protein
LATVQVALALGVQPTSDRLRVIVRMLDLPFSIVVIILKKITWLINSNLICSSQKKEKKS